MLGEMIEAGAFKSEAVACGFESEGKCFLQTIHKEINGPFPASTFVEPIMANGLVKFWLNSAHEQTPKVLPKNLIYKYLQPMFRVYV